MFINFIKSSFLVISFLFVFGGKTIGQEVLENHPLDNMPLVKREPMEVSSFEAPLEQRTIEFRRWLAVSLKISVSGASGSGTIVYYDSSKNTAYVATCGHLWERGVMTYKQGLNKNITCKVSTWYQNDIKLDSPRSYDAKVLFYSYVNGADTALISFQPDWTPSYFPIAPKNYEYKKGSIAHSCGCDGGREVAHYDVEIIGIEDKDLVTKRNSPRPGRSGGGLMNDEYYIGTCWGTSSYDGGGNGFFTPLSVIHSFFKNNEHDFLLNIPSNTGKARLIPIVDKNNKQGKYDEGYVILPGRK
jgi:hypothetical protein